MSSAYLKRIEEASGTLRAALGEARVAVVLGSGLGAIADALTERRTLSFAEIPGFPEATVAGHAGTLESGLLGGQRLWVMRGRFHYYEGYVAEEVTLPVRAMARCGIESLILTNAAGAVNEAYAPGELMLITDFLNCSGVNPLRGPNLADFGPRFPDLSEAMDRGLLDIAREAAERAGMLLRSGVYAQMQGPSYETPAEIRMLRTLGADAVGMSTVPEIIVARHSGMKVLGISCLTNMAAGMLPQPLSHAEVVQTGRSVQSDFQVLLQGIMNEI